MHHIDKISSFYERTLINIRAPTTARHSVSAVPRVASTCEGPRCVGAGSIGMTRRLSNCTFIDVCIQKEDCTRIIIKNAIKIDNAAGVWRVWRFGVGR